MAKQPQRRSLYISLALIAATLGLTYAPLPSSEPQEIVIVSGSELQEPLQKLAQQFQTQNPNIRIAVKNQGSLDMVNRFMDDQNDFQPTILIPANGDLLKNLETRWKAQNNSPIFYNAPQPIAKTRLVAIAWSERGKALFPDGKFSWDRVEKAMQAGSWGSFGGSASWGSFDFAMTDPNRSNSGQLTLGLWLESKLKQTQLSSADLNTPTAQSLIGLVKRSVYQPARSSDILLQEFVAKGANEADIATDYESVALYRWNQSKVSQSQPYRIYDISPTVETTATAAVVRRNTNEDTAKAAQKFLDFVAQPEHQTVLVQYGFRPIDPTIQIESVPNSPWRLGIPGANSKPSTPVIDSPALQTLQEIGRLWERAH
jgi:ABC-type molybdate transport system substrate-binding protein